MLFLAAVFPVVIISRMPERKIDYESIIRKTDIGFMVRAPSMQRLYIDAALALTDHLTKLDLISDSERLQLKVEGETREAVMAHWLNEVASLFDSRKFLTRRIVFDSFDGKKIAATLWGESYSPLKHGSVAGVKIIDANRIELGEQSVADSNFFAKVFLERR